VIVVPIVLRDANGFVARHHRHNREVRGCRFCLGAVHEYGGELLGVVIVGRPVARKLDDGLTAELLRLCTPDDAAKNVCSFLYGRAWRAWRQMGGLRLLTYTLASENGASLRAAGARVVADGVGAEQWSRNGRLRAYDPVSDQLKLRWEWAV